MKQRSLACPLGLGIFIIVIDRLTKNAALLQCAQQGFSINSFMHCELTFNRGISWGLLHSTSTAVFCMVSCLIAVITVLLARYAYNRFYEGYSIIGEVCIIAGSISNFIDRVLYQGVIDFILISYHDISFPVFNGADVAIVVGVGIMILCGYRRS